MLANSAFCRKRPLLLLRHGEQKLIQAGSLYKNDGGRWAEGRHFAFRLTRSRYPGRQGRYESGARGAIFASSRT